MLFNSKWAICKLKYIRFICICHLEVIKRLTSRFHLLHTWHRSSMSFDCKCCMHIKREYMMLNPKWGSFNINWSKFFLICSCHHKVIKSLTSRFHLLHTCHRSSMSFDCKCCSSTYNVSGCCLIPAKKYLSRKRTIFICSYNLKVNKSLICRSELIHTCHHVIWLFVLHAHIEWIGNVKHRVSKFQHKLKKVSSLYVAAILSLSRV